VYVKKGSTISLTCSINVHSTPPGSVLWYHGPSVVDFDSPRGGISLETEKTESGTTSKLLVTKAAVSDSGNYTCVPSNANPASVWVHVLNGEYVVLVTDDDKFLKVRSERVIVICRQQTCVRSDWTKRNDFLISLSWPPQINSGLSWRGQPYWAITLPGSMCRWKKDPVNIVWRTILKVSLVHCVIKFNILYSSTIIFRKINWRKKENAHYKFSRKTWTEETTWESLA
jgi:hypothetical protein